MEVSERTGISQSMLSQLESGARSPSLTTLATLGDVFGINPLRLIEVEGDYCSLSPAERRATRTEEEG